MKKNYKCFKNDMKKPQKEVISSQKRLKVVRAGKRFGKTWLCGYEAVTHAMNYPNSIICYIAPNAMKAKMIMYDGWIRDNVAEDCIDLKNKNDMSIKFNNGSILYIVSSENVHKYHNDYDRKVYNANLIILDECCEMKEDVLDKLDFVFTDKKQTKVLFVSTPRGYNWFYELYQTGLKNKEEYDVFHYTSLEGGNIDKEQINCSGRIMHQKFFLQEFLASFEANIEIAD